MTNKMFHHDQAQHGNLQASNGSSGNQANQTASAERKKKETHCMPKIRMKIMKKKKNNEGKTDDTSSSSSDEGNNQGQGTRKKVCQCLRTFEYM